MASKKRKRNQAKNKRHSPQNRSQKPLEDKEAAEKVIEASSLPDNSEETVSDPKVLEEQNLSSQNNETVAKEELLQTDNITSSTDDKKEPEVLKEPSLTSNEIAKEPSEEPEAIKNPKALFVTIITSILVVAIAVVLLGWLSFGWFGMPPGQAVRVDGKGISKNDIQRWTQITAKSASPDAPPLDGPDYEKCSASYVKQSKAVKQPLSKDEAVKQCKSDAAGVRSTAAQFLISNLWIEAEAKQRNISVSDKEVESSFKERIKSYYPKEADFKKFKKTTGQTDDDLKYRTKIEIYQEKIRNQVTKAAGKYNPSQKEITDYYKKNQANFKAENRWQANLLLTDTEAQANNAAKDLKSGKKIIEVSDKYANKSTKESSKKTVEIPLTDKSFPFAKQLKNAKKNSVLGPKKTAQGWMVVRLNNYRKAEVQSQTKATAQIKQALVSAKAEKAVNDFVIKFQQKWKKQTQCAENYRDISYCRNYKQPKITTSQGAPTTGQTQIPPAQTPPVQK